MIFQRVVLLVAIAVATTHACEFAKFRSQLALIESWKLSFYDKSYLANPNDVAEINLPKTVLFNLYTRSNPNTSQIIYLNDDDSLANSYFDASKPTRFYVHGWQGNLTQFGSPEVRDAYLYAGDYNVFVVDWSAYSRLLSYIVVQSFIPNVSQYLGLFIDYLESNGASVDDMIVTGHSLGAHIASLGAKSATNTMPRVVALDPAGPLYHYANTTKLSTDDAKFVETIFSNVGLIADPNALGHANFYPNGGSIQPGCGTTDAGVCSHVAAYGYFATSIMNPDTFVGYSCDSYSVYEAGSCASNRTAVMGGDDLDTTARGAYYLDTTSASSPIVATVLQVAQKILSVVR